MLGGSQGWPENRHAFQASSQIRWKLEWEPNWWFSSHWELLLWEPLSFFFLILKLETKISQYFSQFFALRFRASRFIFSFLLMGLVWFLCFAFCSCWLSFLIYGSCLALAIRFYLLFGFRYSLLSFAFISCFTLTIHFYLSLLAFVWLSLFTFGFFLGSCFSFLSLIFIFCLLLLFDF